MTEPSTPRGGEYAEILSRLADLRSTVGGKAPEIPLIDPTANVRELVAAEVKRQDDLRAAETRRNDDLRVMALAYEDKLRNAETRRIDAIFAANLNATALANARTEMTAVALADRVSTSATTLATSAGRTGGSSATIGWIFAGLAAVGAIVGIVLALQA